MKSIAVIIRTYSRVEDTKALVEIIKKKWKNNNYTLFIAHNGKKDGYFLDPSLSENATILEYDNNSGHRTGARDLVQNAYAHIENNNNFEYILFIESDFWLLDEKLLCDAIKSKKDISTSIWIEKRQSLGVDFFLVKKAYLDANKELLNWADSPETDMKRAFDKNIEKQGKASLYIFDELRPIHAPSLMRKIFKSFLKLSHYEGGRFRIFPEAMAVTHHIEDLENGIDEKKALANALLGEVFFQTNIKKKLSFLDKNIVKIAKHFPNSAIFKKNYL